MATQTPSVKICPSGVSFTPAVFFDGVDFFAGEDLYVGVGELGCGEFLLRAVGRRDRDAIHLF